MAQNPASNSALGARRAAAQLLRGVLEDHAQLSELMGPQGPLEKLPPADRARAQRLATTTLRHLSRADHLLDQHLERHPPLPALNILRLAVVELCELGEAPHGVVDSAVTLMRKNRKSGQLTGLANAVLRKVAESGPAIWNDLPVPALPKWLRRRIVHIYDEQIVQAIERAHMRGAPLDLTVKDEVTRAEWAETLGAQQLPTGSLRLKNAPQVTDLKGYESGDWWIQDAAAALPVQLLGDLSGARVLDLCAAPGGKTMQLAAKGAEVTALDQSRPRMSRLRENLRRTKLDATLITEDALTWQPEIPFDVVVLDAPCSATGTIRRHPDLPFAKKGNALHGLFDLQSELIDAAVNMLSPGGRLLFCTCSLLTEEGERQVKLAAERHRLVQCALPEFDLPEAAYREAGGIRLRPDFWDECGGLDGFYMNVLEKPH